MGPNPTQDFRLQVTAAKINEPSRAVVPLGPLHICKKFHLPPFFVVGSEINKPDPQHWLKWAFRTTDNRTGIGTALSVRWLGSPNMYSRLAY